MRITVCPGSNVCTVWVVGAESQGLSTRTRSPQEEWGVCTFISYWKRDVGSGQSWDAITYPDLLYRNPTDSWPWESEQLGLWELWTPMHTHGCYLLRWWDGCRGRRVSADTHGVFQGGDWIPLFGRLREWITLCTSTYGSSPVSDTPYFHVGCWKQLFNI